MFNGPGGHSWGAFGLANPHHAMGKTIEYFDQAAGAFVSSGPRTSYNVGRIGGGTSVNSIPFETWIEVDMRSESPEKLKGIEKIFKEQMNKALTDYNAAVKKGTKLTADIEKIGKLVNCVLLIVVAKPVRLLLNKVFLSDVITTSFKVVSANSISTFTCNV